MCPENLQFFEIPFLNNEASFYAQNNLRLSIICCPFFGGLYISSISFVFSFSFGLPIEVILSAILFPIKSPVASAVF